MKNWLIRRLGGYTRCDFSLERLRLCNEIRLLNERLEKAQKNDSPRDPETGRFVSKSKRG